MRRNALIVAMTLASVLALTTLAGCSREKIDWKSAEAADTVEAYDHFIERHPKGQLVAQARARVAQLNEERDWKKATAADTADAYRQFLAQHESGKWAEEARIRVENFSLDGTASGPTAPAPVNAPASAATPAPASLPAHGPKEAQLPPAAATMPAAELKSGAATRASAAKSAVTSTSGASAAKPMVVAKTKPAAEPKSGSATAPAATAKSAPEPKRVAVATVAAAAARPAAPPAQFGIQLGAFRTQDAALKNWKQLQVKYDSDLHGLFAHAVPVKQTAGALFRLQAPVGEESRARAICASLSRQSQPCVVVLPAPEISKP